MTASRGKLNLESLEYIVVNERTGNSVASFLLVTDAARDVLGRRSMEGPNGPWYDIVDREGNSFAHWASQVSKIDGELT